MLSLQKFEIYGAKFAPTPLASSIQLSTLDGDLIVHPTLYQ